MAGDRIANVPRQATGSKSRATLRSKNVVRLVEVLYPPPAETHGGPLFWREIENKWIYIFYQPGMSGSAKLVEEIFADTSANNWVRMLQPGKANDREANKTTAPYPYSKGFAGVPDEHGQYSYFLSPIQLSPKAIQELRKQIEAIPAQGNRWDVGKLSAHSIAADGVQYSYYVSSEFLSVDKPAALHSYSKRLADHLYLVFLLDPFAWTEDIHVLGYQGALESIDQYRPISRMRAMIAQAFVGLINIDGDVLDLANEFPDIPPFWNAQGRSTPQKFYIRRAHLTDGRRRIEYAQKVDAGKWSNLPGSVKSVPELQVKMCEVEDETLKELAFHFAEKLAAWVNSPRHKIVELKCHEMEREPLSLCVIHMAKVTFRTGETAPGQKLLAKMYEESGRVLHELLEQKEASEGAAGVWEKFAPLREVPLSLYKLFENCLGAIAASEGEQFEHVVKSILGTKYFGFKWISPDPKKLPKLWGKTILHSSLKAPKLEVPEKSALAKLADKKELLEKYGISKWFERAEFTTKTINLCLTLYKVMSRKTTTSEKAKAALDTISYSADVYKIRVDINNKELVKFGLMTEEELKEFKPQGFSSGLAKVGAAAGVVSGLVDFLLTVDAFGQSWCLDQNYAVAAVQVVVGLGAAVSITAGVFGLIWGEAVAGPVGWIALAVTLLGLLTAWLIRKLTRNKFEEVAMYSFLGRQHVRGRSENENPFYTDYFSGTSTTFSKSLPNQWRAITGLLSAFKVDAGYADALYGKITVTPGWVQEKTVFRFKWQFQFSAVENDGTTLTPERVFLLELSLKVCDLTYQWHINQSGFTEEMKVQPGITYAVQWEKSENEDDVPSVKSFTLAPTLTEGGFGERLLPSATTFMAQVDVLGDNTVVLPFSDEDAVFKVSSGFLEGEHKGWIGYQASTLHEEGHISVPVGY
jgi:hypothetical protein